MKCRFILVLLLCCGSTIETLDAQIAGGNVSGIVTDSSGASVPQAKVVLRNAATQRVRSLSSNLEGVYTAPNLVSGEYEVTASAAGFKTEFARLTVPIGAEQELNFALRI